MQEACSLGCTPLAPDNLVYPEYLPRKFLYQTDSDNRVTVRGIMAKLEGWLAVITNGEVLPVVNLPGYSANEVRTQYAAVFAELIYRPERLN